MPGSRSSSSYSEMPPSCSPEATRSEVERPSRDSSSGRSAGRGSSTQNGASSSSARTCSRTRGEVAADVTVDHQLHVRPGLLARGGEQRVVAARVGAPRSPAELDRAEAVVEVAARGETHRVGRLAEERRGVALDGVAAAAAEQLHDRHAGGARGQVPQRDVDPADRVQSGTAAAVVPGGLVHPLPREVAIPGAESDDGVLQARSRSRGCAGGPRRSP